MESKRIASACALAVTLTVAIAAQDVRTTPGPVEKAAKAITPENPIPRRIFSVPPTYPPEARAVDASAQVTLRVSLDESGRIAEIRSTSNPFVRIPPAVPSTPDLLRSVAEAMVRAAVAAVSQWQYAAPADGPISFNVVFNFGPGGETTSTQDGKPLVGSNLNVPPPSAPPWPAAEGAVRVGGEVRAPAQTRRVNPIYSAEAQAARVQGVVIMEAIIGEDGRVRDTRVLRSIPLLDQAALDAVRQWEYEPVLLNGKAVPVVMTVTVQFTLS